jgi:hypothetical protein
MDWKSTAQGLAFVAAPLVVAGAAVAVAHVGKTAASNPRRRRPSRAEMIAALGLEPEGHTRGQKYNFSTAEYWDEIQHGTSRAAAKARRKLGID